MVVFIFFNQLSPFLNPQAATSKKTKLLVDVVVDYERIWWKVKPNENPSFLMDEVIPNTYDDLFELICQGCLVDAI